MQLFHACLATKYCQILYFATCFCFVLALLLFALSFSFLIALLTNFSSGVSNALKALDRAFLTFCVYWASLLCTAGKQNKMLLRRLPGPRKRVGERVHTYAHARTKTISRPNWRASVASETLTGVTQSKIGDVCLLASERSERDSNRGR